MNNFWRKINKPIYALATLAGVSDSAFRQVCKSFGADLVYSEMASASAFFYAKNKAENATLDLVKFSKKERPYLVQLFGGRAKHFEEAAKIITKKIKPDGIDINFGCPAPKVIKQNAGAELFKDLKFSREVIKATLAGTNLPVSLKLRVRSGKIDILKFLDHVSDLDVKAVMIHGRSLDQGFSGPANFKIIKEARNYFGGVVLANGGINSRKDAEKALRESGADGLGIARGALGRPWIFAEFKSQGPIPESNNDIIRIILKHARLTFKLKGEKGILELRKHLCWYVGGMPGAKKLRKSLVKVNNINDIENIFKQY